MVVRCIMFAIGMACMRISLSWFMMPIGDARFWAGAGGMAVALINIGGAFTPEDNEPEDSEDK